MKHILFAVLAVAVVSIITLIGPTTPETQTATGRDVTADSTHSSRKHESLQAVLIIDPGPVPPYKE